MRVILAEQHLKPSQRLLVGAALLSCLVTVALFQVLGLRALGLMVPGAALLVAAARYIQGSWIRISPERGLSWCLATRPWSQQKQLGSIELHATEIAEFRLESSLLARLLGLWDLQIIRRDGTALPRFRYFQGMDRVAEELHRYLQQG